jgi:hypothetical protein
LAEVWNFLFWGFSISFPPFSSCFNSTDFLLLMIESCSPHCLHNQVFIAPQRVDVGGKCRHKQQRWKFQRSFMAAFVWAFSMTLLLDIIWCWPEKWSLSAVSLNNTEKQWMIISR